MTTQILMRQGALEPTRIVLFYHIGKVYIIRNVRIGCHRQSAPNVSTCRHMSILTTTYHSLHQWCQSWGLRSWPSVEPQIRLKLPYLYSLTTCHRIGSKFFLCYSGENSNLIQNCDTIFIQNIILK